MIGKRIKTLLGLSLAVVAIACGHDEKSGSNALAANDHPSSRAAVEELYQGVRYGNPDQVLSTESSADFLKKIHGWLVEGAGLKRRQVDQYDLLELQPIPDRVVDEISAVTFGDSFDSGFLLLQASFWKEVARLQRKQGLHIAIMAGGPDKTFVGVTYGDLQLIAVSIIADSGTLRHELRHVEQFGLLAEHPAPLTSLSENCLEQASRFFAELDATTIQLPGWKRIFLDLPSAPASPSPEENGIPKLPSVIDTFLWNLEYPEKAFGWTYQKGCPENLIAAGSEITASTHRFISASDPASGFNQASDIGIRSALLEAGQMTDGIRSAMRNFSEAIDEESASRPRMIRDILSRLPKGIRHDLCHNAMGFELMTDCSAYW